MTAAPPGEPDPIVGRTLDGRYRVEARVGRGGMGQVYRARHLMMDQQVAIKVLNPDRTGDPDAARRFVREARQTFRFDHQNCVRVTDFGASDDGLLYLVMDYLDGRTVADDLNVDGPMAPKRVAHICRQVCDALAHAHAMALVHRDLKPENLMLLRRDGDADFVKVLDFGLAKIYDAESVPGTFFSFSPLTREGMVFGTPEYMSPEQAGGQTLSPATDLYSLGVVAYEMLTLEVPFEGASFMEVLARHVKEAPQPPSRRRPDLAVPEGLERLILLCLEKDPALRPADARALSRSFAELESSLDRPVERVPAALAASETMDLGPAASAALPAPASAPAGRSPAPTATASPPPPAQSAAAASALSEAAPIHSRSVATPVRAQRRHRLVVALAVAGALALVAAGALLGTRVSHDTPERSEAVRSGLPGARTDLEKSFKPSGSTADSHDKTGAIRSGRDAGAERRTLRDPADAGRTHAGSAREVADSQRRHRKSRTDRRAAQAAARVAEAERARTAGNTLKQLANADKARKLDPSNRRARFLFGDALVKTGQKDKGCRYLKPWPRHFRRVGCAD